MKTRNLISPITLAVACLSGTATAADIYGGTGLGFSNNAGQWVANMVFNKKDLKVGTEAVIRTGDDLTPASQKGFGTTLIVPPTKSMAWCDPVSNPDLPGNTDINQCYGWAMFSKWAVLDFNALQKAGIRKFWVSITARRYNDGIAEERDASGKLLAGDDDLIPGLTVFKGRQDVGAHLHWYPNKFQKMPFWAWKLTPFAGGNTKSNGWSTGYMAAGSLDAATVAGQVVLKPGGQNYLSVAIGGDARHEAASSKHDVNFELSVKLYRREPKVGGGGGTTGGGGSAAGKLDKCGCEIGVTEWHASMNHCMAVSLCEPIRGTADECKTPAMCERDGGR